MHGLKLVQQVTAGLGFVLISISVPGINQAKLKDLLPLENTVIIQGMLLLLFSLSLLHSLPSSCIEPMLLLTKKGGRRGKSNTHIHTPPPYAPTRPLRWEDSI